jgi:hypothetical protein
MSNLFAGVYGAKFPEVVMNSGPLPPEGGLPAPLHDTPDARINYGATLLGDLQPYAYGEAGYMSSQSQNNQPHRIQKIIPELYLPEPTGRDVFKLSHAVDDSDLAFVMRLNRNSIFCTGSRTSTRRTTKIGTTVDPIINLSTLNYLLAGLQIGRPDLPGDGSSLWWEFLHNLDPVYWPKEGRNYSADLGEMTAPHSGANPIPGLFEKRHVFMHRPFGLDDIVHIIRHCVKPFGIVRGSERQGGQHEMSSGAATWTTSAIATLVIDGKEANVVNIWHHQDIHAGDDLVLRLKVMPVQTYTLNHYFKGFARKSFEVPAGNNVWQLVPDILHMRLEKEYAFVGNTDFEDKEDQITSFVNTLGNLYVPIPDKTNDTPKTQLRTRHMLAMFTLLGRVPIKSSDYDAVPYLKQINVLYNDVYNDPFYQFPWQQLGFWHIGRAQVMRKKYGQAPFYNDDMANGLKTNHIDMTFQPSFSCLPTIPIGSGFTGILNCIPFTMTGQKESKPEEKWTPDLQLERMQTQHSSWDSDYSEPPLKKQHAWGDDQRYFDTETSSGHWTDITGTYEEPLPPADFETEALAAHDVLTLGEPAAETLAAVVVEQTGTVLDAGISEGSRAELLAGLSATKKTGRGPGKVRKGAEPGGISRGPVEGTLLRPGAEPEACRMELL